MKKKYCKGCMQTFSNHIRCISFFLGMCCYCASVNAQRWQPVIYTGYISGSYDAFGDQHINISDSRYTGFDVEYLLDQTFGIKLGYGRLEANMTAPCCSAKSSTLIERYELGFTARKAISENKLYWTTGIGMGVCRISQQTDHPDELKLATSFTAGLNYHISRFIGVQVQARVLQFYSKAVSGCIASNQPETSSYGTVVTQGALTGGVLFSIGK